MSQIKFKASDFSDMLNMIRGSIPSDSDVAFVKNGQPTVVLKFDQNTVCAEAHNYENSLFSSPVFVESGLDKFDINIPAAWIISNITKAPNEDCVLSILSDDEIEFSSGRFKAVSEYWKYDPLRSGEVSDLNVLLNDFTIDPEEFMYGLQFTSNFMAKDDVRYYLNGVAIDIKDGKLKLVATNGHILGIYERLGDLEIDNKLTCSVIIPNQSINEIVKFLKSNVDHDVKLKFDEMAIQFIGKNNSKFFGMFITGKYPDWRKVIEPSNEPTTMFRIDKTQLIHANDRIKSVSGEKGKVGINWKTHEDLGSTLLTMELDSDSKRKASEGVHIELIDNNSNIDMKISADYIHRVSSAFPSQILEITYENYDKPIILSSEDDERFTSLITPIRK